MKKITLIAPSSPENGLTPDTIAILKNKFEGWGYRLHLGMHVMDEDRYLAGSDENRAKDIMDAFEDDETDVIMTVRGGYGSPRLLDKLDYESIRRHKKTFFAFSDGTALQMALYACAGVEGYTGMQGNFLWQKVSDTLIKSFERVLKGEKLNWQGLSGMVGGKTEGIMLGGNLVVLESLIGTPYFPSMTGKILLLEEVNEEPYKVDRMLAHLRLAGVFDEVSGVVLGDFSSCVSSNPDTGNVDVVLADYFNGLNVPVVHQVPYGHRNGQSVFPVGKRVLLNADDGIIKEI